MSDERKTANQTATALASLEIAGIVAERMMGIDGDKGDVIQASYSLIAAGWRVLETVEGDNAAPVFVDMLRDFADHIEAAVIKDRS